MNRNFERTAAVRNARAWTKGLAALALAGGLASAPALARDRAPSGFLTLANGETHAVQLGVGQSEIVDLGADAKEIFVGDPKVANAIVRSPRRIFLTTLMKGQTTIYALGANGQKIARLDISVGQTDVGELTRILKAAIPTGDIQVRTVGDVIILTGSVASASDAQQASDLANGFVGGAAPSGGGDISTTSSKEAGSLHSSVTTTTSDSGAIPPSKVVNQLMIRGLDQVSLRVTISEIRRDVLKQLGVSYAGAGGNISTALGSGVTGVNITNPFAVNGALGNAATLGWTMAGAKLSATINAFEQEGVARTLAEPTVTAVSGESAKFLAGGTIPILNGELCSAGICTPTLVQQPYGVTLNFTPIVLSQGRIQLHIATEVTDIDYSKQIVISGASVPGFRTRKNETTVELPSGGSIVTAGLISTQSSQAISGLPGLMNLPVLGALFRSRDYQRQETELLVVVTPYIVHAVDAKDVSRPDQNFTDASDPQAWFLGRVNRIYSTSGGLRPMPNYTGRVGFITD